MTEAERLSSFASVPAELAELVVGSAIRADVPLRLLRSGSRARRLIHVRRSIIREARSRGFACWAIGRALNRDHSTILHHERSQ